MSPSPSSRDRNVSRIEVVLAKKDSLVLSVKIDVDFGSRGVRLGPYSGKEFLVKRGSEIHQFRTLVEAWNAFER